MVESTALIREYPVVIEQAVNMHCSQIARGSRILVDTGKRWRKHSKICMLLASFCKKLSAGSGMTNINRPQKL